MKPRTFSLTAAASVFALALYAGAAGAADPNLDAADGQVTAAIASLQAANLPEEKGRRCRKQADKAIKQLRKVQARITAAKACQDGTAPADAKAARKARKGNR